ncbi:glycosyltransferase family 2 protein [Streptococcus danieliae]|uniref:Glycosyltransferase n=1 Tax=Streptococcus danieliae TaxID=747656 RepID=A0A7Z0M7P6_9STRE|nr:glycosyltransferase [Streptococcus danieliae]MBF0699721.1 glycosyltransferase [Streptococcus danieliae]NYS96897.1 glycosyltransferase [Streptococcus danieliae]
MKDPFLTIVVPVYQVEKYLERCVDSILNQNYQDYEIILVDDGSTDRSPEICDEYAEKFEQIQVVHKKNGGMSEARNTGTTLAKGKYVYFIDSDDWLDSSCFEQVIPLVEDGNYDLVCFGRQFVKSEDEALRQVAEPEIRSVTGYDAYLEMMDQGWVTGFVTDKIYKVSLFRENNIEFPIGRYYEDLGVLYRILLNSNQVLLTNQVFYHYFLDNPNSITASWNQKKVQDMLEFYKDAHHSEIVLDNLQESDQHIADVYYVNGLIHVLSSIYKSGYEKEYEYIVEDILNEIKKHPLTYKDMAKQPNKMKYLLYRLSLLKFAFKIQNILRASR